MSEQGGAPSAPVAESSAPVESNTAPVESQGQSAGGAPEIADIQDAVESGELSASEAKSLIKKFKLKVDGKEFEQELDLSNEDAIRNELQLAAVSKKRMQEAAELRKAYQREMERLRSDPMSVLAELGLDPEELSTSYITKKIEEMKKSPEQIAQEKLQKELEETRAEMKRIKEAKEAEETQKLNQQAIAQLNDEIDNAIKGHRKLPNTPAVRKRIADSMLWAINQDPEKYGDITAEDVIPMVEKELREEHSSLYSGLEDDDLEDWIGRERISKMRKKRLAAAKQASVPGLGDVKATTGSMKTQEPAAPAQKIKAKDLFKKLGRG